MSVPETAQARLGAWVDLRHLEQILELAWTRMAAAGRGDRSSRTIRGNGAVEKKGGLRRKGRPGFSSDFDLERDARVQLNQSRRSVRPQE